MADAIKDCSRRGAVVLDAFAGSGTTLIAAETCGRSARVIEYDPLFCDTIIRRWERLTGKAATLVENGATFERTEAERLGGDRGVSDCDDPDDKPPAAVGYGKPPAEHRFSKGSSGNPRGRPRKAAAEPMMNSMRAMQYELISAEAGRLMTIREGDEIKQVPLVLSG